MMDDLGLEEVSFDETNAESGQMIEATSYKAPDSARVSTKQFTYVLCSTVTS